MSPPAPHIHRGFNGTLTFTYTLTDGVSAVRPNATVTITILGPLPPPPVAPVAAADTYACPFNATCTVAAGPGVLANDASANAGATLAVVVGSTQQPASGSVALAADGSFVLTPAM